MDFDVKKMTWDELACAIIDLETEKNELKNVLTKKEISYIKQLIKICESEKILRMKQSLAKGNLVDNLSYGIDYATDWND